MITGDSHTTIKLRDYKTEAIKAVNDADVFRIIRPIAAFVSSTFNSVVLVSLASVLFRAPKSWRM
jgi:hypothetical protein